MNPASFKSNLIAALGVAIIALLAVSAPTFAQDADSLSWTYAQLRGTWEYRTFDDKFTLAFRDDNNMLFDREPATYILSASILSVNDGDNTITYTYTVDRNSLIVTLPDGTTRTYEKQNAGKSEELLTGNFYASADPSRPNVTINFDGNGTFALGTQSTTSSAERYGMYRVQGNQVILAFEDGSVKSAQIQLRDGEEAVVRITYLNRDFETETVQEVASNSGSVDAEAPSAFCNAPGIAPAYIVVEAAPVAYGGGGYVASSVSASPAPAPVSRVVTAPVRSDRASGSSSSSSSRSSGSTRSGRK